MKRAQTQLGQLVERRLVETVALPIDIASVKHRAAERPCGVGGQRDRRAALGSVPEHVGELRVVGECLHGERDAFDHGRGGFGQPAGVLGELIEKAVRGTHPAGQQHLVGAGEVAVDRLSGDAQCACDIGDAQRAVPVRR